MMMDGEFPDYKTNDYNNEISDDENKSIPISVAVTFHEFLVNQLGIRDLDNEEYVIGSQIIGSIHDDGYLRRELINIVDDLALPFGTLRMRGKGSAAGHNGLKNIEEFINFLPTGFSDTW